MVPVIAGVPICDLFMYELNAVMRVNNTESVGDFACNNTLL